MAANADLNKSTMYPSASDTPTTEDLPVVRIFKDNNTVVVKWDDGDTMSGGQTEDYTFHVNRANGKEPRSKTFGSLLGCNGGVLTIGGTDSYRIQVEMGSDTLVLRVGGTHGNNAQQLVSSETAEKVNYMFSRMKMAEEDEKTLLLSKPSLSGYGRALEQLGLVVDAPDWCQDETTKEVCDELGSTMNIFRWNPGKEDSAENRRLYMAYLRNTANITFPVGSKIFDGANAGSFLSTNFVPHGIRTKGSVDVVMAAERHQIIQTTVQNMWSAIELKKQDNQAIQEIRRQVILQHVSASFLNRETGILTIVTDLGPRWHFYWFSKGRNRLMEYQAKSKGEAKYLICHMMEDPDCAISAPTDFLNRSSWNQMYPLQQDMGGIMEESSTDDQDHCHGEHEEDEEHPHSGRKTGEPDKSPLHSNATISGPQGSQRSRHSGSHSGAGMAGHSTLQSLDFMDEEEEREAQLIEVIECLLPQLDFVLSDTQMYQGQQVDGPPTLIEFS